MTVLDFTRRTARADGRAVTRDYLRYLAHHPATARNIARKLALRFVSDTPSTGLIDDLAATSTVVRHQHQGNPAGARRAPRVRSVRRRQGAQPDRGLRRHRAGARRQGEAAATSDDWPFAEAQIWMCKGQYPFMWPRPDGMPQTNAAWSSASQVLGSLDLHYSLAGGWVGDKGTVHYRTAGVVAAAAAAALRRLRRPPVAHAARRASRRPRCSRRRARRPACDTGGDDQQEPRDLVQWLMPRLLTAILDTPDHMTR